VANTALALDSYELAGLNDHPQALVLTTSSFRLPENHPKAVYSATIARSTALFGSLEEEKWHYALQSP